MHPLKRFATGILLICGVMTPALLRADDIKDVQQAVIDDYAAYCGPDEAHYRSLLTEDYVLLENGKLLDVEGDVALRAPPGKAKRSDSFDFRSTKIHGDIAYVVYFLKSDIVDEKGTRHLEWLESAILRRAGTKWLIALLHSTRISKPNT